MVEHVEKHTLETVEDVKKYYDEKFKVLEEKFKMQEIRSQAQAETFHKIIEKKDDAIAKLNKDIGDLQRSLEFMSKETSDIKEHIKNSDNVIKSKFRESASTIENVRAKTVDLEDHSRQSNLIFFNFKEANHGTTENCEEKVENLLKSLDIFGREDIWFDRAHRLGNRRPEHDTKPRPIIVKFSYYKQKEKIIKSGSKFKECPINVSEDYSKDTIQTHAKLRGYGKDAKENLFVDEKLAIKYYKVTYRRLVLTYTTDKRKSDARTFIRSYSLDDIQNNVNWFVPPTRNNE